MTWRALVLVAVTACRGEDKPAPKPTPPKDASDVHAQLLACAPAVPMPIDPRVSRRPFRASREWTPFALLPVTVEDDVSIPVASAMGDAMRERLKLVDNCFGDAIGVVRAMISLDTTGVVESVRTGGLGDANVEECVKEALTGLRIRPIVQFVELACDLARGRPDAPLRVSPDGGYTVVQVSAREVRVADATHALPAKQRITSLGVKSAVLVVADPDATAEGLDFALWWAPPGGTTLVAVKAAGGAPVFAGMGENRAEERGQTVKRLLELKTDNGRMHACLAGSKLGDAPLVDFRAMDAVMAKARAACDAQPCAHTIVVGTSGAFSAKELVATTSAARRAGFAAISIGGTACD